MMHVRLLNKMRSHGNREKILAWLEGYGEQFGTPYPGRALLALERV